jgi:hypothetical protein
MNLLISASAKRDVESTNISGVELQRTRFLMFFSAHICCIKRENGAKKRGKKLHY